MKTNKLILLFVITLIVVVVAVVTTHRQSPTTAEQQTALFPNFKTVINKVNKITVKQGKDTLTVVNEGGKWKISEADGYPALFSKVKQTAMAISGMQVISQKTSNPELYPKLGVEDPASANAKSSLLTLSDASGKTLVTLIIGKKRFSPAASGSHGLYVRLPDKKPALLVAGDLQASVNVADWIDRNLMDIKPERISQIHIAHGGDQDVSYTFDKDKKDIVLQNIPKGKQPRTDYIKNRMKGILEDVRIDGVAAASKIMFPDTAVTATVNTTGGMTVDITSATIDDKHYAKFAFHYTAPEKPAQQAAGAAKDDQDKTGNKNAGKEVDVAKQAAELSAKTTGWVYQIPAYKYDTFTRKLDDLVENIPKKETEDKPAKG